ncbi:hypothetical protein E4T56_gene13543 [Termitomyces sp. T112]|nr:hypothetical protein E4T56_gene13543 [Termitomyces sp. T112]
MTSKSTCNESYILPHCWRATHGSVSNSRGKSRINVNHCASLDVKCPCRFIDSNRVGIPWHSRAHEPVVSCAVAPQEMPHLSFWYQGYNGNHQEKQTSNHMTVATTIASPGDGGPSENQSKAALFDREEDRAE